MLGKIRVYNHNNKCYCPKSDRIFTDMDGNLLEMVFEPVRGLAMAKLPHPLFQVEHGTGIFDTSEPPREIFDGDVIESIMSDGSACRHGVRWGNRNEPAGFVIFHLNMPDIRMNDNAGALSQEWVNYCGIKIKGTIYDGEQIGNTQV